MGPFETERASAVHSTNIFAPKVDFDQALNWGFQGISLREKSTESGHSPPGIINGRFGNRGITKLGNLNRNFTQKWRLLQNCLFREILFEFLGTKELNKVSWALLILAPRKSIFVGIGLQISIWEVENHTAFVLERASKRNLSRLLPKVMDPSLSRFEQTEIFS